MMQSSVFFALTIAGIVIIVADGENLYTDIYDKLDIDAILQKEVIFKQYVNCLLDKGPCTADCRSLRNALPDALKTNCSRCSGVQKKIARKLVTHIHTKKPEIWKELTAKYDPQEKYIGEFEKFLLNTQ